MSAGRKKEEQINEIPPNETIKTMLAHASVRSFEDRPLPAGLLAQLIAAGTRASTSSNMQAYSVIHVEEPSHKTHMAELCADQQQIHQSAAFLAFCADLHKIVLACDLHETETSATGLDESLLIAVIDAALVMQNVALAAESHGLGICMIGAIRNHPEQVRQALALPPHVIAISGLCIGYPAQQHEADYRPRMPVEATLFKNRYANDREVSAQLTIYDETMTDWYRRRDMHPRDPRWTSVTARRLVATAGRAEIGRFLRNQGFLTEGSRD